MSQKRTGTPYRIVVRSELGDRYAAAFDGMHMETGDGQSILTGGRSKTSCIYSASSIALTLWGWCY